jgi:hypothetical protein
VRLKLLYTGLVGVLLLFGCTPADTKPPVVRINQPADGATVNTDSVELRGSATDERTVTRVTYQLNGGDEQRVDVSAGKQVNLEINVSGLREGNNTLTVNAYDALSLKGSAKVSVVYKPLVLTGLVVDNNAGAAVAGSTVTVDGSPATAVTDSDGAFTLHLPAGTYNLSFSKPGYAGSRVEGLRLEADLGPISVVQKRATNPALATTPPSLSVTAGAGGCGGIAAGADFASVTQAQACVPFRITAAAQGSGNMIRYIYAGLAKTPGSAFFSNPRFIWSADVNGPDTGNQQLSGTAVAGVNGPTTFEVVAYDVNDNRVHRIYYLDFSQSTASPSVTPVTNFRVLSVTLAQAVGFYSPPKPTTVRLPAASSISVQGAPSADSTLWVELAWNYSGTNPDRFEVWRSFDGSTFARIATLGGTARTYNDSSPQLAVGRRVYYRVDAVGSTTATGPVLATTPLDRFTVSLLSPAKNQTGVSVRPTLSWSVSRVVGDQRLFAPFVLDYPQQGEYFIWSPYFSTGQLFSDADLAVSGNTYSVAYNADGTASLSRLEAHHAYSFDLSAAAVSFDPADPARVEAISIAQDIWNVFHPLGVCNFGGPVCTGEWNEFVTGDGSY